MTDLSEAPPVLGIRHPSPMKPSMPVVSAIILALALVLPGAVTARDIPAPTPPADGEPATVVDVTDGDTIRVDRGDGGSERLRYVGIDTPETVHPDQPVQPWGPEASAANEQLVAGRAVLLERDVSDRDQYDRLLRYVWVDTPAGWLMVNAELVARGLAEVHAYEPDTRHDAYLRQVEEAARAAGMGMHGEEGDEDEERSLFDRLLDFLGGG
jgi:micrococcal nuclease